MFSLLAAAMTSEYVLISPPKYLEAWKGYVEMRQEDHPSVSFSVTNSFEIYDAYPFPGWMKNGTAVEPVCSNAAESIYHYIRGRWNPDRRQYYVLGGAWLNAGREQDDYEWPRRVVRVRTADGEILSITNTIPGIWVSADPFSTSVAPPAPSDAFYACLGNPEERVTRHPWYDAKTDSYFPTSMTNDTVDTVPDVVVSRMPFVVWTNVVGRIVSVEESITNFAKKVRRAEASDFSGRHCYALLASPGVRGQLRNLAGVLDGENPHRFFDGFDEYCDGDFEWPASDAGIAVRYRMRCWIMPFSPLRRGLFVTRTYHTPRPDVNVDEFFSGDWEMALAKSHGEADCLTDTGVTSDRFLSMTNLCKILMFPMPCNTGWPDWYPDDDRWAMLTNRLHLSLAAMALFNPDGGSVVGIHNSRPGFGSDQAIDVANCADGQSSEVEERILEELFSNHVTVGEAWMRGIGRYARPDRRLSKNAILVALQEMLHGDPLIAITPHEASAGESVVRWGVSGDCDDLPPVWRVTDAASVTNGDLSTSGIGGINRLEFCGRKGDLTLAGNGEFFVNAVTNGGTLAIKGSNKHVWLESCDITNLILSATGGTVLTNELSVSASARLTKLEIAIDGDVLLRATGTNVYSVAQGVHVSGAGRLTIPNVGLFGPNVTADPGVKLDYNSGKRKGLILIFR